MTDHAQPAPLDLAVIDATVCGVLDTLPHSPGANPEEITALRQAALISIASLDPTTPLQAMLAAQVIAAHHAVLDDLRRAMLPDATDAMAVRLRSNAATMSRLMIATLRELRTMQAEDAPGVAAPQPGRAVIRTTPPPAQAAPIPAAAAPPADRKYPEPREQPAARPPAMIDLPPEMGRSAILATASAEVALQARVLAGAQHDLRQRADGSAAQAR